MPGHSADGKGPRHAAICRDCNFALSLTCRMSALPIFLPAIEHRGFPIDELHWDARIEADTEEEWTGAFEHFGISGKMHWTRRRADRGRARSRHRGLAIRLQV